MTKRQFLRLATAATFCMGNAGCGGGSSAPSSVTSATPRPVAGPFVAASAFDESPIAGATLSPPYSAALADSAVIQISAPGFIGLRTLAGYLRQKGGRIYLLPETADRERLAQLHGTLTSLPTSGLSHWDVAGIGVESSALILADAQALTAMSDGIARFNGHLANVHTRVRVTAAPQGPLRLTTLGVGWGCGLSAGGIHTNCSYDFLSIEQARQANLWVRALFLSVGPVRGVVPGTGLTGRDSYTTFNDLSSQEIGVLRLVYNRCNGARLSTAQLETEDHLQTCFIP